MSERPKLSPESDADETFSPEEIHMILINFEAKAGSSDGCFVPEAESPATELDTEDSGGYVEYIQDGQGGIKVNYVYEAD